MLNEVCVGESRGVVAQSGTAGPRNSLEKAGEEGNEDLKMKFSKNVIQIKQ